MATLPKHILLVEDDDLVRMLIQEVLEELGYRVQAEADAFAALEHLRENEHFDLLMSDVGLPDMDGRALVAAARQLRPTLPVLFASGYDERELLDEVRARDTQTRTESIVKPFDLPRLAILIEALSRT